MMHFRKRGNKWSFSIYVGIDPITGKRKQTTRSGFKTKREAQEYAAKMQTEINEGTYINESSMTFKSFAQEWLKMYIEQKEVKPATARIRQNEINRLTPYFVNIKLKDITRIMYQDALNDLKEKYADSTLSGVHRTGRMIFRKALELEKIKKDPTEFAYVKKTKKTVEQLEEEELPNYLEKEELALFLHTAKTKGLYMDEIIFHTLAYTGMRIGELISLKWKDLDFKKNTISISKTYYNETNKITQFELVTPKTDKSRRVITVDQDVMNLLRKHRIEQNELKLLNRDYRDEGFVFANAGKHAGYPLVLKKIGERMSRLLSLTKLKQELTPHSLRHTHTSLLAELGVNLETIMDRLGHKSDATTRNIYLHVTKEVKKEASHKFGELMRSLKK